MFKTVKNLFLHSLMLCIVAVTLSSGLTAVAAAPSLEVSGAQGAAGSTVNIKISIKNNPGLSSLKLSVSYSRYLSLTNIYDINKRLGTAVIDPSYANPQKLFWYDINGSTENGLLATLSFRVADNVPNGEAGLISVSVEEALDKNTNRVSFATVSSTAICTHRATSERVMSKSTCVRAGEVSVVCNTCNKVLQKKNLPLSEHTYSKFSVTKDATCTSVGERVAVCVVCGQKHTTSIPKTSHEYKDSVTIKGPTCTENGISVRSCKYCGDKIETEIMKMEHSFPKYTVTTTPTLSSEGLKTSKCIRCGAEQTEAIIPQVLDSATSVAVAAKLGTFDSGTSLLVKTVSMSDSVYTDLRTVMSDVSTTFKAYNISYLNNAQPVLPKGTVTLYIPLKPYDFEKSQLYFYDENSKTVEKIDVTYHEAENDSKTISKSYVKLTTDRVGYFVLANTAKATEGYGKADDKPVVADIIEKSNGLIVWIVAGVCVLIVLTLIIRFAISRAKTKKTKKNNNISNLENFYTGADNDENS